MQKTDNVTSATMRAEIVKILGARIAYAKEHIRVWRFKDVQAVLVPEDWYERACAALGEEERINMAVPGADTQKKAS